MTSENFTPLESRVKSFGEIKNDTAALAVSERFLLLTFFCVVVSISNDHSSSSCPQASQVPVRHKNTACQRVLSAVRLRGTTRSTPDFRPAEDCEFEIGILNLIFLI